MFDSLVTDASSVTQSSGHQSVGWGEGVFQGVWKYTFRKRKVAPLYAVKEYIGVKFLSFLTLALNGGEWPVLRYGCSIPGKTASDTHWIGGWVSPRGGLDVIDKKKKYFAPTGFRTPDRLAHSLVNLLVH
jgi:hypothetical protein